MTRPRDLGLLMRRILIAAILGLSTTSLSVPAVGTGVPIGSQDRKVIMSLLRPYAEKEHGAPVIFRTKSLRISRDWAFVSVEPMRSIGKPLRVYWQGGWMNDYEEALLRRQGGRWTVVRFVSRPGDVWQCGPAYIAVVPTEVLGRC